jgi:DNA (cytosine-5)-methyltransferase 1
MMKDLRPEDFVPPANVERVRVCDALAGLPVKVSPRWQTEEQGWRIARVKGSGYYQSRLQGHIPAGVGDPHALLCLSKENRVSGCLGTKHSRTVTLRYARVPHGTRDRISKSHRLDPNGFCPTIRAGTGPERGRFQAVRPLHPAQSRVITPREAARLQGFPDWFQFAPTKWHSFRQIGGSVSPILAERILGVLRKALDDGGPIEG